MIIMKDSQQVLLFNRFTGEYSYIFDTKNINDSYTAIKSFPDTNRLFTVRGSHCSTYSYEPNNSALSKINLESSKHFFTKGVGSGDGMLKSMIAFRKVILVPCHTYIESINVVHGKKVGSLTNLEGFRSFCVYDPEDIHPNGEKKWNNGWFGLVNIPKLFVLTDNGKIESYVINSDGDRFNPDMQEAMYIPDKPAVAKHDAIAVNGRYIATTDHCGERSLNIFSRLNQRMIYTMEYKSSRIL